MADRIDTTMLGVTEVTRDIFLLTSDRSANKSEGKSEGINDR